MQAIFPIFKNRGVQIFCLLSVYFSIAAFLPLKVHSGLYTISLLIKDVLLWILPLVVCFFVSFALASFEKKALLFLGFLFLFEAFSNFSSVWYAYFCGKLALGSFSIFKTSNLENPDNFSALWQISHFRPAWWSADKGVFLGVFIGLLAAFGIDFFRKISSVGKKVFEKLLAGFFSKLIPFFILGFVAKMYQTQFFSQLFKSYSVLLVWLIAILMLYLSFLFLLGSGLKIKSFARDLKNLLPAGGVALSSGCSLSTMPLTIEGAAKNLKNPRLAKTLIPATTNIQQIGDCIANAFLCFLIYSQFYQTAPSFEMWAWFSLVFVLARFTTAAVIGGSIFIMLPIYESYLNFTAEMVALILAFNVILDPLITASNVVANGALCKVFENFWQKLIGKHSLSVEEK